MADICGAYGCASKVRIASFTIFVRPVARQYNKAIDSTIVMVEPNARLCPHRGAGQERFYILLAAICFPYMHCRETATNAVS